ncbi:MAG: GntR family transcriptional regulator [Gammaproteobacteria bacterium]|nr:GntR family transcriptional regulator [Gammaproteobacteria bacterium]
MEFHAQQAIYLQIADRICEQVLRKELNSDERISSVREMAVSIEVNPNTVVRTYAYLEEQGIIYKQRGVGYFIAKDAYQRTLNLKKEYFLKRELPVFYKTMSLLGIEFEQLKELTDKIN